MQHFDVLIVGAGHAGAQLASSLRQQKFEGSIALLGDEPDPPYERPPLSKAYFSGEVPFERIMIRPPSFWADRDVALLAGREVVAVRPDAHQVATAAGETFGYSVLVWSTGGAPRSLVCSGHDLRGVHTVRNRADVDRMVGELPAVGRVVVIGGGYIGLEAAAVLTKLDKPVVLLEALDRVLARVAGEDLSRFYEREHRQHGVDVRLGARVDCLEERDGRVSGVRLGDGEVLPADMVIVGIGIVPAVAPLAAAGAACGNGVLVDELCRTSLPDVFAIGDCALHRNRFADGATIRLESVQNANDMATVVARSLVGTPQPYDAVPWFWSEQYDLRLQTVGLSGGHDRVVVRGDPAERRFSVIYLRDGEVIALDCVNSTKDYVQGRALVVRRARPNQDLLSNPAIPLKELA